MSDLLAPVFLVAFLAEAIAVIAMARLVRRAHRNNAKWQAVADDALKVADTYRGAAESWQRTAEEWADSDTHDDGGPHA